MVEKILTGQELIKLIGTELYGEKFSIENENVKKAYKKVYDCFIEGLNTKNKGVLVIGNIGVGKSAMMKVIQRLFKDTDRCFKKVNSTELKDMSEELTSGQIKDVYGYELKQDLYIDDIGLFSDVKRYGNTVNIISEIILERYNLFVECGFKTHFSSNVVAALTNKESTVPTLEKMYGNRILDRIKEMCYLIDFNGESLRK